MALQVVLVEPLIPQNTGTIARLTAATGVHLHLVEPLGFELTDKYLKRAGLDYWPEVKLSVHKNWADCLANLWLDGEQRASSGFSPLMPSAAILMPATERMMSWSSAMKSAD